MRDWWTCGTVYRNWNTEKLVALALLKFVACVRIILKFDVIK